MLMIATKSRKPSHKNKKLKLALIMPALFNNALAILSVKNKVKAKISSLVIKICFRSFTEVLAIVNIQSQGTIMKCTKLTVDGNFASVRTAEKKADANAIITRAVS